MYNFNNVLFPGEQILYEGKPEIGKEKKGIPGLLLIILFLGVTMFILLKYFSLNLSCIVISIVCALFLLFSIYALVDKLVLHKMRLTDVYYCVTNQRALTYSGKKDELKFGYLKNYKNIECYNIKNEYGSIRMSIYTDEDAANINSGDEKVATAQAFQAISNSVINPQSDDMPFMVFESIKDPMNVEQIIRNVTNGQN